MKKIDSSEEVLKRRSLSSELILSEKCLNKKKLTSHLDSQIVGCCAKASSSGGLLSIGKPQFPRDSSLILHSSKSNNELEWDRDKDFHFKIESETLSYYDLNEHATELINSVSVLYY